MCRASTVQERVGVGRYRVARAEEGDIVWGQRIVQLSLSLQLIHQKEEKQTQSALDVLEN